ncbi:hypothetical protein Mal15_43930 [Stieleria maiorica]|uniref:Uncharacterized protein n=1 Tax=Stieleria maiorica TaxID=2795974 RepID=A0A5B9MGC9_9BACT|nr:hypothetical protein [Stieleria maiorica]QEG00323.1 hypothetical protein Mal15_43930 [Stieleria maiorica]
MHTFPDFRCPAEAMGLVGILFSLLAMWVALGRGHWWIRSAVGVTALGLLLPLHAYQPIVFFSLAGVGSVLLLSLLRCIAQRDHVHRRHPRTVPPLWHRIEFWSGALTGLVVAAACVGWAVRIFWDFGWLETFLVFLPVFFSIELVAMLFGDAFRLGPRSLSRSHSFDLSFRLFEVMLAIVLLAVLFAVNMFALQRGSNPHWPSMLGSAGLMMAATVSIAAIFMDFRARWRIVAMTILAVVLGMAFQFGTAGGKWLMQASSLFFFPGAPYSTMIGAYSAALLMTTLCAATAGAFRSQPIDAPGQRATRQVARVASCSLMGLYGICVIPIALRMASPLAPPDPIDQDTTAYQQLEATMAKAMMLNPKEHTLKDLAQAGQKKNADTINAAYASIRRSARQRLRAPDPLAGKTDVNNLGQKLNVFRSWARCMHKEAKVMVTNGQFSEASESWIDCIYVGHGLGRGSDFSHTLTGIAIEGIGHEGLTRIRKDLPIEQLTELLPALIMIDRQREPLDSIRRRTDLMMDQWLAWQYRLAMHAPAHLSAQTASETRTLVSPTVEATDDAIRRRDAAMRMLIAEFAGRIFSEKHGRMPGELEELVPEFLPSIPIDPYTDRPLIYRHTDQGFVVYSAGRNGIDDGGQFGDITTLPQDGSDFDLETLIRPIRTSTAVGFGGMN